MENLQFEKKAKESGYTHIAGIDEVGRGCFAGPVVACAVVLPEGFVLEGLTDSKVVSKKKHKDFAKQIQEHALDWCIGIASVEEVDEINIKQATRLAMKRAVEGLNFSPDYLLIDGNEVVNLPIQQESIIKGDSKSLSISAASIVAKDFRDTLMAELDEKYNNRYGWESNAGYQTKKHIEACHTYGITEHHRKTWKTMELFSDK